MAKPILVRAWIDRARVESTDQSDTATAVVLRSWRDAAMDDMQTGVRITSVTFSGEGQSGVVEISSQELMEIAQEAIEKLENQRDANAGVSGIRHTGAPGKGSLTVEVYKLNERPDKPFSQSAEIPGTKPPVPYVSTYVNSIVFEPQAGKVNEAGCYWVRISGGGVREQYLVELF